ncbi:glutamine--fructose-6-phosphate transaminase (isomerizing) [Candidatus Uhrbacteria bacterium]|nr:glutamine--fructose-6-phosphate transaminase (isomerizing) [Candidatus Uhrbacteria bacterium]
MCGIIGYIGKQQALPIILDGLHRMEYRGYDSAGVVLIEKGHALLEKKKGKIANLETALAGRTFVSTVGVGHIRWATHGEPSDRNAHPHADCKNVIYVAHNGIIENADVLRDRLTKEGHIFRSETDTEILSHCIEKYYGDSVTLEQAVDQALRDVVGAYGIVVLSEREPRKIIAARLGSPLVLGIVQGDGYIVASDVTALLRYTRQVVYIEDNELVTIVDGNYTIHHHGAEEAVTRKAEEVEWDVTQAEKGGHAHFMEKEIFEQPAALRDSLRGRIIAEDGVAKLGGLEDVEERLRRITRLIIIACGTARHAGLVGEYMLEEYARVPVEVEYASEFRYRQPLLTAETAVLALSQSGETADTLAAVREAKRKGALSLGIVNVVGSTIARETDAGVYNHVGPEIAVASTKAFTSQIAIMALMTVMLGRDRQLSLVQGSNILRGLLAIPDKMEKIFLMNEQIRALAKKYASYNNFAYIGRKYNAAIAYEGALKLKEISYVHAEGFAAGEMKHGAIALIDPKFPTVAIAPKDSVYEKNVSNIQEIRARKGPVIAIATEGDTDIQRIVDDVIYVPETLEILTPLLTVVPLQLFAYHMAIARGCDVDQPRNLAKSVTVE